MPSPSTIAPELIHEAAAFLGGKIRQTPLEHSPELSSLLGVPIYLKLENLQLTGSFKIRGAWFKLAKLSAPAVLTCSAGNHGKGVAYAARELGIRAIVCVPNTIDQAKYKGMIEQFEFVKRQNVRVFNEGNSFECPLNVAFV